MNKPAIEKALNKLKAQQFTEPGEERTCAIEEALADLDKVAPASMNVIVGTVRRFVHRGACDITIIITPAEFNVVVEWKD